MFLKLYSQDQGEFERLLESLVNDQTVLSEESIDKFISLQLSHAPPNFEVASAIMNPLRHNVADALFRAIVARGPVTCESQLNARMHWEPDDKKSSIIMIKFANKLMHIRKRIPALCR